MTAAARGFLSEMMAAARERVAEARERVPLEPPANPPAPGRLHAALAHPQDRRRDAVLASAGRPSLALIAEIKRRSPSRGEIAPALNAVAQAMAYAAAGADAISVLTEPGQFAGSLDDLRDVVAAVDLPVLRKDFIVDEYQVWETAHAGAAGLLLIASGLPAHDLERLLGACAVCGLDALVEVHDGVDLRRARRAGAQLIGINNRDLRTLRVDIGTTVNLMRMVDRSDFVISESGFKSAADAARVARAGVKGLLVGETLVRATPADLPRLISAMKHPGDA